MKPSLPRPSPPLPTPSAQEASPRLTPLTHLVLTLFRVEARLCSEGDRLGADLGLTSARWKVLGALTLEQRPLTVAQIGRRMGLTRQAVQRVANDLVHLGFLEPRDNPDHRRAPLFCITPPGTQAYGILMARYAAWEARLGQGLPPEAIQNALSVLQTLDARLEENAD